MKDYREKEMKYLSLILAFLFLLWCTPAFSCSLDATNIVTMLKSIIVSSILSLTVFLCDCLINNNIKDKLVGLFFIPRPGNTIFTRIASNSIADDRFLTSDAKIIYNTIISGIPQEKDEKHKYENANWYQIYLCHQEKGQVIQCQKDSLLCRDLFIETISFIVIYGFLILLFYGMVKFSVTFIGILILMAIITNIATHIKMDRFVNTVIAVDIASIKNESKAMK